jgi:uncharacterized protein YecE (DUF72 family)
MYGSTPTRHAACLNPDMTARVRIGTSGWEYDHWRDSFYPRDLPRERWLEHYAERFETVELNASFYRLPAARTFDRWQARVPSDFRFAVKGSRYLTHLRRLNQPEEPLERLWARARRLGDRLGPMLYQLPPRWLPNPDRLAAFLGALPRDQDQAIEFRDRRWYRADIIELLERAGVALCLHDMAGSAPEPVPVGRFVYLRFHGAGTRYGGRYPDVAIDAWSERIAGWAATSRPVWAYFNNDAGGHAVRDADRLRSAVAARLAPTASACSSSGT